MSERDVESRPEREDILRLVPTSVIKNLELISTCMSAVSDSRGACLFPQALAAMTLRYLR